MLNLNALDRVTLAFIGDGISNHVNIVVTDVVYKVDGEPLWIEGYSINTVGKKPNPTTIYPWTAIKSIRPLQNQA